MLVIAGESLIDLVAEPRRAGGTVRLAAHPGGSPYNCAIALARLGVQTGFLCPISSDAFGELLAGPLAESGVVRLLEEPSGSPTTLAVVALDTRGRARYQFYRNGTADNDFTGQTLLAALPERIAAFQIGGFCAIREEDASVWLEIATEAARRGALLSFDPNLRPSLVEDFEAYRARLERFFDLAHLIKLSDEDLALLDPDAGIKEHARRLLGRSNCRLVVVTLGENGAAAFSRTTEAQVSSFKPNKFGDTVGAGDTLMAGILATLSDRGALSEAGLDALDTEALTAVLEFGSVAAGLNCAHRGSHPPSRPEVEAGLAEFALTSM